MPASLNQTDEWDNETMIEEVPIKGNRSVNGTHLTMLQQIGPILLRVGKVELDVLSLLRCSCLLYIGLCVFWLIAIVCLAMSLRYEVLDLVYVNTFVLTISLIYTLIQAILVGVIIFYQVCVEFKRKNEFKFRTNSIGQFCLWSQEQSEATLFVSFLNV